jgi:hypothetical protein
MFKSFSPMWFALFVLYFVCRVYNTSHALALSRSPRLPVSSPLLVLTRPMAPSTGSLPYLRPTRCQCRLLPHFLAHNPQPQQHPRFCLSSSLR